MVSKLNGLKIFIVMFIIAVGFSCSDENPIDSTLGFDTTSNSSIFDTTQTSTSDSSSISSVSSTQSFDTTSASSTSSSTSSLTSSSVNSNSSDETESSENSSHSIVSSSSSSSSFDNQTLIFAINSGSNSREEIEGITFEADRFSSGGSANSTTSTISGTSLQSLYQTERYGSYNYKIPVTNGEYSVVLHLVEMYWTETGERLFNLSVEDNSVLTNFDLYSQVGHNSAYRHVVENISVSDGFLEIFVETVSDNGTLSGFEIYSSNGLLDSTGFSTGGSIIESTLENSGSDCPKPNVAFNPNTLLPDPFEWSNQSGSISTMDDWRCRRNEIKTEIEHYEIGEKPNPPSNVTAAYSGGTMTVTVTEGSRSLTLTSRFSVPSGIGPFPVIIGMNSGTGSLAARHFSGMLQVPFNHDQIVNYNMNGQRSQSDPFYQLYPDRWGNIANYSAWAWGVSRIIDGLYILQDELNIDVSRIGVTGCSYAGKMALFAGAFDQRVALTIAQESGGGGITSWRVSETLGNVEKIDNTNYSWFLQSMQRLNPNDLPHDHHELIAMIAPRAFLALGNEGWEWMADESGYVSLRAAHEVWKALGASDRFGFDMSGGHQHCQCSSTQDDAVSKFVSRFLGGNESTNTAIYTHPYPNLNYQSWWDWTTPTLR